MLTDLKELAKSLAFRYTNLAAPRYHYNLDPIQLTTLINEFERLKDVQGAIVEIGVARGMTTNFLATHIVQSGLEKSLTYYALDTFESFLEKDIDYEVNSRSKIRAEFKGFKYNDFEVWKKNFREFPFVKAVKVDCAEFDYAAAAPIKLSLLDVDLYLPTAATLPKLYDATVPGGVILVDDVKKNNRYDGAYQAYVEFCKERGITEEVIGEKCGIIRKDK